MVSALWSSPFGFQMDFTTEALNVCDSQVVFCTARAPVVFPPCAEATPSNGPLDLRLSKNRKAKDCTWIHQMCVGGDGSSEVGHISPCAKSYRCSHLPTAAAWPDIKEWETAPQPPSS